jgi:hypothetical protein
MVENGNSMQSDDAIEAHTAVVEMLSSSIGSATKAKASLIEEKKASWPVSGIPANWRCRCVVKDQTS